MGKEFMPKSCAKNKEEQELGTTANRYLSPVALDFGGMVGMSLDLHKISSNS